MGFKPRPAPKKVHLHPSVVAECRHNECRREPGVLDKRYTGMSKLNDVTWVVAFRCAFCGATWGENLGKIEAHTARRMYWGPGFSEDVEAYIAMVNGWRAKEAERAGAR